MAEHNEALTTAAVLDVLLDEKSPRPAGLGCEVEAGGWVRLWRDPTAADPWALLTANRAFESGIAHGRNGKAHLGIELVLERGDTAADVRRIAGAAAGFELANGVPAQPAPSVAAAMALDIDRLIQAEPLEIVFSDGKSAHLKARGAAAEQGATVRCLDRGIVRVAHELRRGRRGQLTDLQRLAVADLLLRVSGAIRGIRAEAEEQDDVVVLTLAAQMPVAAASGTRLRHAVNALAAGRRLCWREVHELCADDATARDYFHFTATEQEIHCRKQA